MRNGLIAYYKQFLLFLQCFPQLHISLRQFAALCGNGFKEKNIKMVAANNCNDRRGGGGASKGNNSKYNTNKNLCSYFPY